MEASPRPEPGYAKEAQQLIANGKTKEDFRKLAKYFQDRQQMYLERADKYEEEYWHARNLIQVPKYPTTADTAKWRAHDAHRRAVEAARLASEFQAKSAEDGQGQ